MSTIKLGRKKEHRERTLRNVATSLLLYEKITTTKARAKAVTPLVERLLSTARQNSLSARREAKSILFDSNAVRKLFEDIITRMEHRTSGFLRLTKVAPRPGDRASMVQLELLITPLEKVIETEKVTS